MNLRRGLPLAVLIACSALLIPVPAARSGVHLWRITELFSNADGTIQFIEMTTCCGSAGGEIFVSGQHLSSNSHDFIFPANLTMATANKHLLLATDGYAALPGAPVRDYTIPANFFSTSGDTLTFAVYDTWTVPGAAIPTNGTSSVNKNQDDATDTPFTATNSPTNLHEGTGSVTVVTGPPAIPDGRGGSTPLTVAPLASDGSSLRLSYDAASCTNASSHHLIYGQRTGLPSAPGGGFTVLGALCNIGNASTYDWTSIPDPPDGAGLLWYLIVAADATNVEGSWGKDGAGNERLGPGAGGSDGICSTAKSVTNSCGQ
ncbi:MAG TPA: hypothetical protein VMQ62_05160 [Dongiaceae bacterium]|nr:hypothetical protein [Dongiaceae bacterium]